MALIDRFRRRTARDNTAPDNTTGEGTAREQAAHEQAAHEQAAREQAARAQLTRDNTMRDHAAVGTFIDEQSFHLAQGCVQDYARLRVGADALLADASFAVALDKACWEGYPRALAMVGTVVESLLRPHAGDNLQASQLGLTATILENFDRRPVPPVIGDVDWRAARTDLERSLGDFARARPKTADAVAEDHSSFYLAIMPLHPKLGADDFPALRNQLKRSLLQIQETFVQRADLPALAGELMAQKPNVEASDASSALS
ncbi:MAG: hypothetical protein GEU95_10950 [Rhizobiales bacterium]|nr:hypothetical protein [Hyphomicrobiales bacterium]